MSYILNIDTATTVCSVSLSKDEQIIFFKELDNGFTHAENLHLFITDILKDANIKPTDLDAIAVSKGPGSYTGLRIGVSAAKGLAYALKIPLISIDTLQLMSAFAFSTKKEDALYCPMIDARRMEVYTCLYNVNLEPISQIVSLIVDEKSIELFNRDLKVYFFGDGMPKCKEILSLIERAGFIENITPTAKFMCSLSYKKFKNEQFEDVAYFEPFYLKDFLLTKKKS